MVTSGEFSFKVDIYIFYICIQKKILKAFWFSTVFSILALHCYSYNE